MTLQERINAAKKSNKRLSDLDPKKATIQATPQAVSKAPGQTGGRSGAGQSTGVTRSRTAGMTLEERINAAKKSDRLLSGLVSSPDVNEGLYEWKKAQQQPDPLRERTTSLVKTVTTPLMDQMRDSAGAKLGRMDDLRDQLRQAALEKQQLEMETPTGATRLPKSWGDVGGVNSRGEEITKRQSALRQELDQLEAEQQQARTAYAQAQAYQRWQGYENAPQAADFAEKSQYRPTRKSDEEIQAQRGPLSALVPATGVMDYEDIIYDALNGDEEAREKASIAQYRQYKDLNDKDLAIFNYLYATKGKSAAYQFLDDINQGEKFSGEQAAAFGFANALGVNSIGAVAGKVIADVTGSETLDRRNREGYQQTMQDLYQAQKQHPGAFGAGAVGGNLALLGGTGAALGAAEGALATGINIGGRTVAVTMSPVVQGVVNSSLSFLTADAVRNAGAAATGYMSPKDYLKNAGVAGVQGLAGGLAGGLVGSGMAKVLRETGMMTPFMEFVRQSASGFASAGANIGTGYLLSDEKPNKEQIATDLATAFLFSILQGGISTYKTTQVSKAQMNAALDEIIQRYGEMSQSWETMTPEARAEAANYIMAQTESLRRSLNSTYMAGQQSTVDQLDQALNGITQGMQWYINNFQAYQSATTAPGNMLGSGAYGSGTGAVAVSADPTGGSELAWVQSQLQTALSQGIAQGQDVTPAGIVPAGAVGALSGRAADSRPHEGMPDVEPDAMAALRRAAEEMDQAGASPTADSAAAFAAAVTEEAQRGGDEVPVTIDPEGMDIVDRGEIGLARAEDGPRGDVPSTVTPATQTAQQTQRRAPVETDSREGTVAFGRETVERFTRDLSPALATTLREMYNEYQEPAAYLEDMMRAHKAGSEGITDPRAVFGPGLESAHITLPQAQAAMLAGRNNGGTEYEQGAEAVRVRNGGQRADGAHPGGQVRQLEGGAGQNQGGDLQGRPADAGAATLAHGRKVSTASLGIGGGSDSDGIYIVNRGADTPATAAARKLAKERGLRLTLFVGDNLSIKKGSAYASVRGYVSGDRVFIRADHPRYTADQIMRHEAGHSMIRAGEVDPDTVRERISEKFGQEKADRLAGLYEAAYRGTGLTSGEVWEETICDSLGDMNIFDETVEEGEVQEFLEEVKKAASAEQATKRNRGPPAEVGKPIKEDGRNGRKGEVRTGADSDFQEEAQGTDQGAGKDDQRVRRELSASSGRHREVNPDFGEKPVRTWAEGHVVEPSDGSTAYVEQQIAMEYGVASFVISDEEWTKNKGDTLAFAAGGQVYLRENLPQDKEGMFAPHEITHVMMQKGYTPYLDFVERTPSMLNMSDPYTQAMLRMVAKHQGATLESADPALLYDEFNATMYGHIATGKVEMFQSGDGENVFNDFEAYAAELTAIHEQFKAENSEKSKFSMELPVEETKDLLALHNLTEKNLLDALQLGGLPMPSIAIVKAEAGHTNYGPISLVFEKDTIDPQQSRANKVYGSDAWTPTAPRVEYRVNMEKLLKVERELADLASETAGGMFHHSSFIRALGIEEASALDADELAERLSHEDTTIAAYLAEHGKRLEPVRKAKQWNNRFDNAILQAFVDKIGVQELARLNAERAAGGSIDELVEQAKHLLLDTVMESYEPHSFNGKPMTEELRQKRKQAFANNQLQSPFAVEDAVKDAWRMYQDGGATKGENDRLATHDALQAAVDYKDVETWVRGKLEGVIGEKGIRNEEDEFTSVGDRRPFSQLHYAYTLENIVAAMKEGQSARGEGSIGLTAGSLQALSSPEYKSVREIKADSGRLRTEDSEAYAAALEAVDNQIADVLDKIAKENPGFDKYDLVNHSEYILREAAQSGGTELDIEDAFLQAGMKALPRTVKMIQKLFRSAAMLPTEYFEAKPQRAVGFDEVLAAVVPDTSSNELRTKLEDAGVRVLDYKAGDDADRLAKVNSVEGARFSQELPGIEALRRENEELKASLDEFRGIARTAERKGAQADYWKGQTKLTTPEALTVRQGDVAKLARELTTGWGSTVAPGEIVQDLTKVGEYLLRGENGSGEIDTRKLWELAQPIGKALVETAQERTNDLYEQYSDLRSYLRETPFTISEADSHDIPGFEDFRRRNFGRLRIKKGESSNIDTFYGEMSSRWKEFFVEDEVSSAGDMLLKMEEVLDQLAPVYENPYSGDMAEATRAATNAVIDGMLGESVRQQAPTFADRQARKLEQAIAKGKQAVARERVKRNEQVQRIREHYAEMRQRQSERRSAAELRRKITKHSKALSDKLLHPTDKQHIPEELRGAVAAMLEAINQESQYTVDPETEKRSKGQDGNPTKRTEAFRALRDQYEAIRKGRTDFTGVLDPDLLDNLAEVIAMRDVRLADMTSTQLTTVWQVVRAVDRSVFTANKLLGQSRFKGVKELADGIRSSSFSRRAKSDYGGKGLGRVTGFADRLLNLDMMTPLTFFHQFGEGGDALYHELQAARDQKTRILAEVADQVQRIIGKTDINKLRKETHTFQVTGGEITLTTAQIMSLYELSKREQAQDHIYKGGLRASPIETGVDRSKSAKENVAAVLGKMEAPAAGVHVSLDDVANILSTLTDRQVQIADGLQGIMQGYLSQEGNRESMKVYGYEKFGEPNYFPISSDPHQVQDKIGDVLENGQKRPRSIAEWGSAKATVEKASNGLLLGDIFDVFAQHAVDMATYASHLGAMEDLNRVRNFTFRDDDGVRIGTMGDIIQRVTGQGGGAYLNKLLQDVSAGTAKNSVTGLGKLTANYKAASVGWNVRVALQQPTSYLRAAAVIDAKYLADPRVLKKGGWAKALKYAPIAVWKDWGNFEINQGRELQNIMFNTDSKLEKVRNASMWMAGGMDSLTWGRIWNACELEITDTKPSLARGSAEFYEAVAQRFTDIIDQTQVVDNVLGRSQIMRSSDGLAKMATSYMGEPSQSYNLVYRALRDAYQEQDSAKRTAAKKVLGRAIVALVASLFVNAIAQSLWDAVRDDDDRDKKYLERVLGHIPENFVDNIDPTGMVPYLKDIKSLLQGYDIKRMDTEAIASFISACQGMNKAINGEGRYTLAGAGANLVAETARIFGLPAATVKRDLVAMARTVGVETGNWYFQYQLEKALNSVGYSGNRGEFYDIAWGALKNGELDVYQTITQDLIANGVKASAIENAMMDRLKKARENDLSFNISQQARDLISSRDSYGTKGKEDSFTADDLAPEDYQRFNTQRAESYRQVVDELEGFSAFRRLDGDTKDKALAAADTLTEKLALEAASKGAYTADTKWILWASGGEDAGVSEAEAILFKLAYDMTSGDIDENGNTISGSKKENVLDAATDMMPWLTDEELVYLMSNYWK